MRARCAIRLIAAFVLLEAPVAALRAQETIFNVPSPDVLEKGKLYLETDHYFRSWNTVSGHTGIFLVRAVVGVGHNVEIGLNSGSFDYLHASAPFVDGTLKWRPIRTGTLGLVLGDNAGIGLTNSTSGDFRNLAYTSGFVTVPGAKTRASAGPYCATRNVFGDRRRCGAQVTVEQPIPGVNGLELAADWFSGGGAFATTGVIWTVRRVVFYAGYGFANAGRQDDLVTLELGVNLF